MITIKKLNTLPVTTHWGRHISSNLAPINQGILKGEQINLKGNSYEPLQTSAAASRVRTGNETSRRAASLTDGIFNQTISEELRGD